MIPPMVLAPSWRSSEDTQAKWRPRSRLGRLGQIRKNLEQVVERASVNIARQLWFPRIGRLPCEMLLRRASYVQQ
jgi:hypothetical protein